MVFYPSMCRHMYISSVLCHSQTWHLFKSYNSPLTHVYLIANDKCKKALENIKALIEVEVFVHLMQLHRLQIKDFCFTVYSIEDGEGLVELLKHKNHIKWWRSLQLAFTKHLEVDCLFQTLSWKQRLHCLHFYTVGHESFWLYSYSM